jgi:TorA maturation chaperone TorD
MENQADLTELYNEPTYDELKDVLQNFLNPSDDTQAAAATASTTTTEKVAEQTATTAKADVSDAFDELFNG